MDHLILRGNSFMGLLQTYWPGQDRWVFFWLGYEVRLGDLLGRGGAPCGAFFPASQETPNLTSKTYQTTPQPNPSDQ